MTEGVRACVCCTERLPETDCEGSEVERTSWALKQSIRGGPEESQEPVGLEECVKDKRQGSSGHVTDFWGAFQVSTRIFL